MKPILLLLPLLLTSCSNPDTSGGVTLSKGADDANEFPHGSCEGQGKNPHAYDLGCGWITAHEKSYYIMPRAGLTNANLRHADLIAAILIAAILTGVKANRWTRCPNGKKWGTAGNDCGF